MTITPQEIAELAIKKYGKKWQSIMAREVVGMTGCNLRTAILTIHRLSKGKGPKGSSATPLAEVAIRLLTRLE